jgi:succinoglycan biosynthesis protein ExoA
MKKPLRLCALIVTHRRPDWLKRCVLSVSTAVAGTPGIELSFLIWINGPDPESVTVARGLEVELGNDYPLRVECASMVSTPAEARNRALLQTDSEWIFFIDDDAFINEGFFEEFLGALGFFPRAAVIGGPNLTPPASSLFQRASGLMLSTRLAAYTSSARYVGSGRVRQCHEESLILCNLFVKKGELRPAPFPADFFCGEENWLLQSMRDQDVEMIYQPALYVFHERRAGLGAFLNQVFRYGAGRGKNIRLRPATFKAPHIVPSLCLIYLVWASAMGLKIGRMSSLSVGLLVAYALLCAGSAFASLIRTRCTEETVRTAAVSLFLYPLLHVSYGLGVIYGLLDLNYGSLLSHLFRGNPSLDKR